MRIDMDGGPNIKKWGIHRSQSGAFMYRRMGNIRFYREIMPFYGRTIQLSELLHFTQNYGQHGFNIFQLLLLTDPSLTSHSWDWTEWDVTVTRHMLELEFQKAGLGIKEWSWDGLRMNEVQLYEPSRHAEHPSNIRVQLVKHHVCIYVTMQPISWFDIIHHICLISKHKQIRRKQLTPT